MTREVPTPTDVLNTDSLDDADSGVTAIIAGSRSTTDENGLNLQQQTLLHLLTGVFTNIDITPSVVVSGTARGVDTAGEQWAESRNIPVAQFEAPWNDIDHPDAVVREGKYGKYDASAGYRRNQWMADFALHHGDRGILVALLDYENNQDDGGGTGMMINIARDTLGDENTFVVPVTEISGDEYRQKVSPVIVD